MCIPGSEAFALQLTEHLETQYCTMSCVMCEDECYTTPADGLAQIDKATLCALLPVCHRLIVVAAEPVDLSQLQLVLNSRACRACVLIARNRGQADSCQGSGSACEHTCVSASFVTGRELISALHGGTQELTIQSTVAGMQEWIGVTDSALECLTDSSLKGLRTSPKYICDGLKVAPCCSSDLFSLCASELTRLQFQQPTLSENNKQDCGSHLQAPDGAPVSGIGDACQLAMHVIRTNTHVKLLDLSSVEVSVHAARVLAQQLLMSSQCRVNVITLSKVSIPVGHLSGRMKQCRQGGEICKDLSHSDASAYLVLPGSGATDSDLALMTTLLQEGPRTWRSVVLQGRLRVSQDLVQDLANAVAELPCLECVQGVLCAPFRGHNGIVKLVPEVHGGRASPLGEFGAAVAAQLLLQQCSKNDVQAQTKHFDGNTLDGSLKNPSIPCTQGSCACLGSVDLRGAELGPSGSVYMTRALASADYEQSLSLKLQCTLPGLQGCTSWASFIQSCVAAHLTMLNFSNNNVDDKQISLLGFALGCCSRTFP
jgi:hypothetical protein